MRKLISCKFGGEQGQGIESAGEVVATVCNRLGYYIYAYRHFSSRIKGGHSNYKLRVGVDPVASTSGDLDVLVAIDQESIDLNHHELVEGGLVIADAHFEPALPAGSRAHLLAVPLSTIAQEVGSSLYRNVVAVGAAAFAMGLPLEVVTDVVTERFARKGGEVQEQNARALRLGYEFAADRLPAERPWKLAPGDGKVRLALTGNDGVALGALAAGCRVCAAYPITPASEVMESLNHLFPQFGGVVIQAEDEISAITTCIGAGFAGARAITATAGPGISLMQEAIGLAYMAEIPVVIVDCQRGGPSTGMPTKHEQSDLWAILFGSHGDSQRLALCPSSPEEAFYDTALAFNLADHFQCPVFVVQDLSIALNKQTVEGLDLSRIVIDRGELVGDEELASLDDPDGFRRYRITESGVSPRPLPGQPKGQYLATGVEHNEYGKVSENPANRVAMMNKRMRKMRKLSIPGISYHGEPEPDVLLIGMGASRGPLAEAVKELAQRGVAAGHTQMRVLAPFPAQELADRIAKARRVLVAENNASGQLATLVELHVGRVMRERGKPMPEVHSLLKYDGNPFLPEEIVERAEEVVSYAKAG